MLNKHIKQTKNEFENKFVEGDGVTIRDSVILAFIEKQERLLVKKINKKWIDAITKNQMMFLRTGDSEIDIDKAERVRQVLRIEIFGKMKLDSSKLREELRDMIKRQKNKNL